MQTSLITKTFYLWVGGGRRDVLGVFGTPVYRGRVLHVVQPHSEVRRGRDQEADDQTPHEHRGGDHVVVRQSETEDAQHHKNADDERQRRDGVTALGRQIHVSEQILEQVRGLEQGNHSLDSPLSSEDLRRRVYYHKKPKKSIISILHNWMRQQK
jgi:hypothetical protein